jgi:hypothetical protein
VLALKCFSVDQFTIRPFKHLNSAVLAPFEIEGLDDSSLSTEKGGLGVVAIGVFVANPPIGHFQSLLLGNATIAPFNNPAKSMMNGRQKPRAAGLPPAAGNREGETPRAGPGWESARGEQRALGFDRPTK